MDEKDQGKSFLDIMAEQEFAMTENRDNFKSKETIDRVKTEAFSNSVFLTHFGNGRIWKPDRFLQAGR